MIIGWDVSTSAIGICVRDDDGKVIEFEVIFPVGVTHAIKHRNAAHRVKQFCERYRETKTHIVEERLGGFTGGLTTKQTLMCLAAMNAVISYVLADSGTVIQIPPNTTKRITGLKVPKGGNKKAEVIKLVRSREPTFPYAETAGGNWVKGTDDMADAWLLAEAGGKIARGEASIGQPEKTRSRKGKARRAKGDGTQEG